MTYSGPKIGNWYYADLDFRTGSTVNLADGAHTVNGYNVVVRQNAEAQTNGIQQAGAAGLRVRPVYTGGGTTSKLINFGATWGSALQCPNIGVPLSNIPILQSFLNTVEGAFDISIWVAWSTASSTYSSTSANDWGMSYVALTDTTYPYGESSRYPTFIAIQRGFHNGAHGEVVVANAAGFSTPHNWNLFQSGGIIQPQTQSLRMNLFDYESNTVSMNDGTYIGGTGVWPTTWTMMGSTQTFSNIYPHDTHSSNLELQIGAWTGGGSGSPQNMVCEVEKIRVMWR